MSDPNGSSYKDKPLFDLPSGRRSRRRRVLGYVAAAVWLALSVYPVYLYWVDGSGALLRRRQPPEPRIITETVAVPEIAEGGSPGRPSTRLLDNTNAFKHFKQDARCAVDSLALHTPFEPLCGDKDQLLDAMSNGGRIGVDAPYVPRACDMRWFTPTEICRIMAKFEKIFVVGDTMMRHLAIALQVFLRADLIHGARTSWDMPPDDLDCSCRAPFEQPKCTQRAATSTADVVRHEPGSLFCNANHFGGFEYVAMLEYPIKANDVKSLAKWLAPERPLRPYAFVLGHGLWNDLDKDKTFAWIDQFNDDVAEEAPYLVRGRGSFFPRLFVTPSAAGVRKPDLFVGRQGNIALAKFEQAVAPFVKYRGLDHLGTYNMTIQASNPDGTHGGLETNLIKAMMVFNWLNALAIPEAYEPGKAMAGH